MKHLIILFFLYSNTLLSQGAPPYFNYQVALRDINGMPVKNSPTVYFKISILKGSKNGFLVYQEKAEVPTNNYGVASFLIGKGKDAINSITSIPFATDSFFIKIEILDITNGLYQEISNTKLVSVPYALYSNQLDQNNATIGQVLTWTGSKWEPNKITLSIQGNKLSISNGNTVTIPTNGGTNSFIHYIGEIYNGGIVFYVYKDQFGFEHGLIASLFDFQNIWSNSSISVGNANSSWDGLSNSNAISMQSQTNSNAANSALNYSYSGFNDWYLPSIDELILLSKDRYLLNKSLDIKSNATFNEISLNKYWSSTQYLSQSALFFDFGENRIGNATKTTNLACRFIRQF